MGIFDRLVSGGPESITPYDGLLLAAVTMIAVDGDIDDDEISVLRRLNRKSGGDLDKVIRIWKKLSIEDCVRLVAESVNSNQQVTVLANLIDIAMADGVLVGNEKRLLEEYVSMFEVSDSVIESIVDVVSVKNNIDGF